MMSVNSIHCVLCRINAFKSTCRNLRWLLEKKSKHRQEKDRVFSLDSLSARKHHKALICFLSSLSANLYVPYLVLHVAYPCAGQWTSVAAGASFPQTSQVTV